MALTTFQDLWRDMQLMAPNLPLPIAQRLVNNALVRVYDSFRWSSLRAEGEFFLEAGDDTGTVTVTAGSATVTGAGTAWTTALEGMQFYVGGEAPFYTVSDVTSGTTLTLDRVYGAEDGAGLTYAIQPIYLSVPSDFLHFIDIVDVENNWRLRWGCTAEQLDLVDAARTDSGTPFLFAAIQPTSVGGRPRYEIYPRPPLAGGQSYHFRYQRRLPELTANSDLPAFPVRPQTLREGALEELSRWPGTADRPNPYFSLDLSAFHRKQFDEAMGRDNKQDQEINMTELSYEPPSSSLPWAPMSAAFMQSHLFTAWGWPSGGFWS